MYGTSKLVTLQLLATVAEQKLCCAVTGLSVHVHICKASDSLHRISVFFADGPLNVHCGVALKEGLRRSQTKRERRDSQG